MLGRGATLVKRGVQQVPCPSSSSLQKRSYNGLARQIQRRGQGGRKVANLRSNPQLTQKRGIVLAFPLLIPGMVAAFVGITFWQVYKKRQIDNAVERGERLPEVIEEEEENEDPRLRGNAPRDSGARKGKD